MDEALALLLGFDLSAKPHKDSDLAFVSVSAFPPFFSSFLPFALKCNKNALQQG
ncbi:MAG: hypothetical protein U0Y10_24685 [Spirosomataceae bacterium]